MYANAQTLVPLAGTLLSPLNVIDFNALGCARLDVSVVEQK
jgi:hypothetical protein